MSRIDVLIRELCPEGVPRYSLGELVAVTGGFAFPSSGFNAEGQGLRVIRIGDVNSDRSRIFWAGDYPVNSLVERGDLLISLSGDINVVNWTSEPALLNQRVAKLVAKQGTLLSRFLFHFLKLKLRDLTADTSKSVVANLSISSLKSFNVPLPPLEIQREIVSILDKFTQLEAELEAELEARRVQYEETRNILLNFDQDLSSHPLSELIRELCPEGVQFIELGRVLEHLRTGLNPRSNFSLNGPNATGWYVTVRELAGFDVRFHANTDRLDSEALEVIQARSQLKSGDVLFSGTGTIGRTAIVTDAPSDWNIKEGVYALTPSKDSIDSRFLVYLFHSASVRKDILSRAAGSTVQSIPFSALQKVLIPVPPLKIQREIVSILDKLYALVNDISFGLPAEIAARRKQYEYYRNKLLTFKELDAA